MTVSDYRAPARAAKRLAKDVVGRFKRHTAKGQPTAEEPKRSARPRIDTLRARKEQLDTQIVAELERRLRPRALREGGEKHRERTMRLLSFAEPRHMSHPMLRRMERNDLSLDSGISFTSIMVEQSEARRLGVFRPGWLLDNKANAYSFLDDLGVRRPHCDRTVQRIDEIEPHSPIIIKPVRSTGSKGVYAVFSSSRISHLRDGKELTSWEEMLAHARWLMSPERSRPLPDRWMVEELILEDPAAQRPARDLKFYAFYGDIILIRESMRENKKLHVRFWTPDGEKVNIGHNEDPDVTDPAGVTAEQLKYIESISTEIPVPFMRIDMLLGQEGLVFGEFTPRPGSFDKTSRAWDRRFGEAWVKAEGRILEDVLAGKDFSTFATMVQQRKKGK